MWAAKHCSSAGSKFWLGTVIIMNCTLKIVLNSKPCFRIMTLEPIRTDIDMNLELLFFLYNFGFINVTSMHMFSRISHYAGHDVDSNLSIEISVQNSFSTGCPAIIFHRENKNKMKIHILEISSILWIC